MNLKQISNLLFQSFNKFEVPKKKRVKIISKEVQFYFIFMRVKMNYYSEKFQFVKPFEYIISKANKKTL